MKESDGAEQPTTGHWTPKEGQALGRITLWKSYALIRLEKIMIRGAAGWKNQRHGSNRMRKSSPGAANVELHSKTMREDYL